MTFDPSQHPRGNALTGHAGQFAAKAQSVPEAHLDAATRLVDVLGSGQYDVVRTRISGGADHPGVTPALLIRDTEGRRHYVFTSDTGELQFSSPSGTTPPELKASLVANAALVRSELDSPTSVAVGKWDGITTAAGSFGTPDEARLYAQGALVLLETGQMQDRPEARDTVEQIADALDVYDDFAPGTTLKRMQLSATRKASHWVCNMVLGSENVHVRDVDRVSKQWAAARDAGISGVAFVDSYEGGKNRTIA